MKIALGIMLEFVARFDRNEFPHQRFGQAFINAHGEDCGIPRDDCSSLWEATRKEAEKTIWGQYVDQS